MSTKNNKKDSQKKSLPVHQFTENPVLIISDNVASQINFLHRKVGGDEWSGILLYSHRKGDIGDADNLVLVAEEIYPMDIGTPGYTEYINDVESILELVDNYPRYESGDLKIGHIHSHHSMGTGFSSTDMSELQGNAPSHNYYLSLIVNFKAKPTAKIATICEVQPGKVTHPGANDNVTKELDSEERLGVYDVIITQEFEQKFLDRYSFVQKKKKEKKKKAKAKKKFSSNRKKTYPGISQTVKGWDPHGTQQRDGSGIPYGEDGQGRFGFFEPDFSEEQIDQFIYKWFNLNPNLGVAGKTEGAVDMLDLWLSDASGSEISDYVDSLIESYEDFAMQVIGFDFGLTDDEYLKLTKIVIQKLEPYEENRVIKPLLNELEIYEETLTEMVEQGQ